MFLPGWLPEEMEQNVHPHFRINHLGLVELCIGQIGDETVQCVQPAQGIRPTAMVLWVVL